MKKTIKSTILVLFSLLFVFCLFSCNTVDKEGVWENATYRKVVEFGKGEKTLTVVVKAAEQSITFTIKTDKATVGEALLEHELISGEQGQYGMYIKSVNGIEADFDKDQAYWAFYNGDDYMLVGVAEAVITGGEHYRLVYTQ